MKTLIVNANVVNEGSVFPSDVLIEKGRISRVASRISSEVATVVDAKGSYLLPGAIDCHVHFREPGLTHKGDIFTESRAAVAGGITSFMDMPNTIPPAVDHARLEEKYLLASQKSLANFSFYLGATNHNLEELLRADLSAVCGIKVFLGSSTGGMCVDDARALEAIFSRCPHLIAVHCEDEATIRKNLARARERFGDDIPAACHPEIRSEEACFLSSSYAVEMASAWNTRLHLLHLSTSREATLLNNSSPAEKKRITAEVCVHHLWFDSSAYGNLGARIRWNPAIKRAADREGLWAALSDNRIDLIATDHAPHTAEEKKLPYAECPSGAPMVQHALVAMMECVRAGNISVERVVEKFCHAPAICFRVKERGFIREGYHADLCIVNPDAPWKVERGNILSKCGWSPFEGLTFHARVIHTFVSGNHVFRCTEGARPRMEFQEIYKGRRLNFQGLQ